MRRIFLVIVGLFTLGAVLAAGVATADSGDARWNRAYVVMAGGLLVATAYYALQTYDTVAELRAQRRDSIEQRQTAETAQLRSIREAVAGELRQIQSMINVQRGHGANYMNLPSAAWSASFYRPDAISDDARKTLFEMYSEVERINAIGRFLLSPRGTAEAAAMGLERDTEGSQLAKRIGAFLDDGSLGTA